MTTNDFIAETERWIQSFVINLNLCPFAVQPFSEKSIRYVEVDSKESEPVVLATMSEAKWLSQQIELYTSFIITPKIDLAFEHFYDFCSDIQELLDQEEDIDIVLVAFHPEFRYAHEADKNTSNATNRSPYPMIHLIPGHHFHNIPEDRINQLIQHNKDLLESMSWQQIKALYS